MPANKHQILIDARKKLLDAIQQGCRAADLAEVKDGTGAPLVTLSWYADANPESFIIVDIRRADAQIGTARTLDDAVDLLCRVAGEVSGIAWHALCDAPVVDITPRPHPTLGHTFKLDTDLIDWHLGNITEAEYRRRQEVKRLARNGGHYKGSVPGGVT